MRESTIENKVCNYATKQGWYVYKCTGLKGAPDRILHKEGKTFYIEFKRPGGTPTKMQKVFHKRLTAHGIAVFIIDDIEEGMRCVDSQ